MKLIKPKAELIIQKNGLNELYKHIEKCSRVCYKSEDKITEDSAKPFVDRMIKSNHLAMLEHGTVYLIIKWWHIFRFFKYLLNPYSKIKRFKYITTNLRVIKEHNWDNDLKYICEPTEYHEKRYTFRVVTSISVTREFNRHRVNSIAEQSTRYCNYSKDKFGNEITFIEPCIGFDELSRNIFESHLSDAESHYMALINAGWKAQEAREVLPLCTATEAVYTAFVKDWQHFFDLRYFGKTGAPHPNMVELTGLMAKEADKYGIWKELCNQNVEKA